MARMNATPLDQKVSVVVGGTTGSGLSGGAACVAAGARAGVVGRDASSAAEGDRALGGAARSLVGDATASHTARRAGKLAVAAFGRLGGLYHAAGGSGRQQGDGS